jgi:hypothetical protein
MTEDSKIFSNKFMTHNIKKNSKAKSFGINIDSSMIWSLKSLKAKEVMFGHVKTMMVMFNPI